MLCLSVSCTQFQSASVKKHHTEQSSYRSEILAAVDMKANAKTCGPGLTPMEACERNFVNPMVL